MVDLIAGQVIDNLGYFAQEVFFLCFLAIGIILLVLLIFHLAGTENFVNISGRKRKKASVVHDLQDNSTTSSTTVEVWRPNSKDTSDSDTDIND